jgi:hypothetical protein
VRYVKYRATESFLIKALAECVCDFDSELDKPLRMCEHFRHFAFKASLIEPEHEIRVLREMLPEKLLFVGQAQCIKAVRAEGAVMWAQRRVRRHIDNAKRVLDQLSRSTVVGPVNVPCTLAGEIDVFPVVAMDLDWEVT